MSVRPAHDNVSPMYRRPLRSGENKHSKLYYMSTVNCGGSKGRSAGGRGGVAASDGHRHAGRRVNFFGARG